MNSHVPMVYIVSQLKAVPVLGGGKNRLAHIGVKIEAGTWVPLCQRDRDNPSRCEYQYRTVLSRITCSDCRKTHKEDTT